VFSQAQGKTVFDPPSACDDLETRRDYIYAWIHFWTGYQIKVGARDGKGTKALCQTARGPTGNPVNATQKAE
jgi:hypothetical protein